MVVVAATHNRNKIKEIDAITSSYGFKIISLKEAGYEDLHIEENGDTFEANSLIKAKAIWGRTGLPSIADDSGLAVDILSGEPGVRSARYAGEFAEDRENNEKLLGLMKDIPPEKRGAGFICVITMILPHGKIITARGECRGTILTEPRGSEGFGYDPIFMPLGYCVSFGELPAHVKNQISHRAVALAVLKEKLDESGGVFGHDLKTE
ncbi:MAG: RdgB/HAM1 family non-canonical purine NTP pyrophosphatase [Anaerovoracaceae bacterium]|jgi:XTP/dITP diphosphohydrolase